MVSRKEGPRPGISLGQESSLLWSGQVVSGPPLGVALLGVVMQDGQVVWGPGMALCIWSPRGGSPEGPLVTSLV